MISKDRVAQAILKFADAEILPMLPRSGQWVVGTYFVIASRKMTEIINTLIDNPMISALGISDDNGDIDIMTVMDALEQTAGKYGKLTLELPIVGTMSFNESDVMKLKQYMRDESGY